MPDTIPMVIDLDCAEPVYRHPVGGFVDVDVDSLPPMRPCSVTSGQLIRVQSKVYVVRKFVPGVGLMVAGPHLIDWKPVD